MRFHRNLVIWPIAAALAVAAGWAAIATSSPGPEVLSADQAAGRLDRARASAPAPAVTLNPAMKLAADEWWGLLPSASVVARCAPAGVEVVRSDGLGMSALRPGARQTVSGFVDMDKERITFTLRCIDGMPTGVYRWLPQGSHRKNDEGPQDMQFGKWVDTGLTACKAPGSPEPVDPANCVRVAVPVLSGPPRRS